MIGTTVSHYRVIEKLGSGGMGVVYPRRGHTSRPCRGAEVPSRGASAGCAGLERFQREARAAQSALNHPGICTVHDIDVHEGRWFIAMELLEGQTLGDRIAGRPLPLAQLLDLGMQIANVLEGAHKRGVVHRDLKPANIFVTPRGQAKLLDFGIAKVTHVVAAPGATGGVTAPDLTSTGTVVVLGRLFTEPRTRCECGARVFELYTHRDCGTAYLRVFGAGPGADFFWHEKGGTLKDFGKPLHELHLFLEEPHPKMKGAVKPIIIDTITGRVVPSISAEISVSTVYLPVFPPRARKTLQPLATARIVLDEYGPAGP